jgi:hypothetical protein
MYFAPSVTASFTAVPRSATVGELPSTSRMLQAGQAEETASRSREVSRAQPVSSGG